MTSISAVSASSYSSVGSYGTYSGYGTFGGYGSYGGAGIYGIPQARRAAETTETVDAATGIPQVLRPAGGSWATAALSNGRGENAALSDPSKLSTLSDMLEMDEQEVTDQATNPAKLVELIRDRGLDLGTLRNVLSSGDLLDVRA